MRSFWAKIFVCMLLVPILGRGGGLLLEATLSDPRPQSERAMAMLLPGMAALAGHAAQQGGGLGAALGADHGLVRLLSAAAHCRDARPGAIVVPIPGSATCLGAVAPPRPLVLGLVPATFRVLLPTLELVCCGFLSFFLAGLLAEPIVRTRNAARAFAAGNLAARAMPRRRPHWPDEADELEREFNRMADRIAAMIAAQRRFIGDVSHEIRSPLGRLGLALDLARRDSPAGLLPRLDRMEQELDTMTALVKELLLLATLEGSTAAPEVALVDVGALVGEVVEDLGFEFSDRAARIHLAEEAGRVVLSCNASLLRRAIENVLRNALFYTPAGSRVEVWVAREASWAVLRVRDHGPGVPEAALSQLFEPFFRVDAARARQTGGAGLGLAISQRAVALHGGEITAANVSPSGLSVTIRLRAEPAAVQLSSTRSAENRLEPQRTGS